MTDTLEPVECDHQWRWSDSRNAFVCRRCYEIDEALEDGECYTAAFDDLPDAGKSSIQAIVGALVMLVGFWIVPMHAMHNAAWSIAALACITIGSALCAVGALDLLDERR